MMGKKLPRADYLMQNKISYLILILLLYTPTSFAEKWSMDFCKSVSAETNINLPMLVDSVTELRNTFCLPGQDGPTFNYNYVVAESIRSIPDSQRDIVKRSWCTTPELLDMLNSLSGVGFSYYRDNGDFVGKFSFSQKNCN